MLQISELFPEEIVGLKIAKLIKDPSYEVLSISMEKGTLFPDHTAPRNAHLIMLEGEIDFYINDETYKLSGSQLFSFPKDVTHRVHALNNAKFLILR